MGNWPTRNQSRGPASPVGSDPGNPGVNISPVYGQSPYPPSPRPAPYRYATFWNRVGAWLIDFVIDWVGVAIAMIVGSIAYIIGVSSASTKGGDYVDTIGEFVILAPVIWKVAFIAAGGTPGQRLTGLRVTNSGGDKPGFARSLRRNVLYLSTAIGLLALIVIDSLNRTPAWQEHLGTSRTVIWVVAVVAYTLSSLVCITDQHGQTLHDKFAGTYVIRT